MKLVVKVIFKALIGIITGIFTPILDAISSILPPGIENALGMVASFLNWLKTFIIFVLSWLPFDSTFWTFLIGVFVFRISVFIVIDIIKLAVKWWHALAP